MLLVAAMKKVFLDLKNLRQKVAQACLQFYCALLIDKLQQKKTDYIIIFMSVSQVNFCRNLFNQKNCIDTKNRFTFLGDRIKRSICVLSCALFWRTKHKFEKNLVPKIATTKGISKPVFFCAPVAKSA